MPMVHIVLARSKKGFSIWTCPKTLWTYEKCSQYYYVHKFIFQMPLISFNLRNLLLTTAVIATLLLLFVAIGPQGVSPVSAMSEKLEAKSFKNLNLKASVLPVSSFKGGDVAPGVSIKSDNVNVLVSKLRLL